MEYIGAWSCIAYVPDAHRQYAARVVCLDGEMWRTQRRGGFTFIVAHGQRDWLFLFLANKLVGWGARVQ